MSVDTQIPSVIKPLLAKSVRSIAATWYGRLLLRATALLSFVIAYLAVLGKGYRSYGEDLTTFHAQMPGVFWAFALFCPSFIAAFSVGPECWRWHQEWRRKLAAASTPPDLGRSERYFRLDPYTTERPEDFKREDRAHETVLDWLLKATHPLLFLSGPSGSGKSSVLEGYILPMLPHPEWVVEEIRTSGNPTDALDAALRKRRARGTRLLILFDQFEEFIILEDRAASESGRQFLERVRRFRENPAPGTKILFVFRTDYLKGVIELDLDRLISNQNWQEIDLFNRAAARKFLMNSPLQPSVGTANELLDSVEAIEEAKGLYRPVTLNMIGIAIQDLDRVTTRRPEQTIRGYLETALKQTAIGDVAPRVVAAFISDANTKRPRTVSEVARELTLKTSDVMACLNLLLRKGLMRPVGAETELWEISHDFVAKQLAIVLGRLRPRLWPRIAVWASPVAFCCAFGMLVLAVPIYLRQSSYQHLAGLGIKVTSEKNGAVDVAFVYDFSNDDPPGNEDLAEAAPYIAQLRARQLDLSAGEFSDLTPIANLTTLEDLDLGSTGVSKIQPLHGLVNLRSLDISADGIADIQPLANLVAMTNLTANSNNITDIGPLRNLRLLRTLNLSVTGITDLTPLMSLTELRSLDLGATPVKDLTPIANLRKLTTLSVGNTDISDLTPLADLTALQSLDLNHTHAAALAPIGHLTALQFLDLSGVNVANLDFLNGLTALVTLKLGNTPVTDISPLTKLDKIRTLILDNTRVMDLTPLQGMSALSILNLRGANVRDLNALSGLGKLQTLDISGLPVTDLGPLRALTALQSLTLGGMQVADLSAMVGMTALHTLNVSQTRVGTLIAIAYHQNLQTLTASGSRITDLASLQGLPMLRTLDASNTRMRSLGLQQDLGAVETLNVSGTDLTDLSDLRHLPTLRTLNISNTPVADISMLSRMNRLNNVNLSSTKVAKDDPILSKLRGRGVTITIDP
jgi:Leucine-rich repeat (LRR) protein